MACTQGDVLVNTEVLPTPNQHTPQNTWGYLQAKLPLMGHIKAVSGQTGLCATDMQQESPSKTNYRINLVFFC